MTPAERALLVEAVRWARANGFLRPGRWTRAFGNHRAYWSTVDGSAVHVSAAKWVQGEGWLRLGPVEATSVTEALEALARWGLIPAFRTAYDTAAERSGGAA